MSGCNIRDREKRRGHVECSLSEGGTVAVASEDDREDRFLTITSFSQPPEKFWAIPNRHGTSGGGAKESGPFDLFD